MRTKSCTGKNWGVGSEKMTGLASARRESQPVRNYIIIIIRDIGKGKFLRACCTRFNSRLTENAENDLQATCKNLFCGLGSTNDVHYPSFSVFPWSPPAGRQSGMEKRRSRICFAKMKTTRREKSERRDSCDCSASNAELVRGFEARYIISN